MQAHSCAHMSARTDEWQMCEEEAKASVMDRREGCCSNPASYLLYLGHWPVLVASRPCCVHGEWPDLILDCLAVCGGLEAWGFPTWHLSNSGGSSTGKPIMVLVGPDCSLEWSGNEQAHRRAEQTSPLTVVCHVQTIVRLCLVDNSEVPSKVIGRSNESLLFKVGCDMYGNTTKPKLKQYSRHN